MTNVVISQAEMKALLDREADRFNTPEFIEVDPVQFPRRFERLQDIEIVSLLASTIAWGNRKMICRNIEKMLRLMDYQPYNYLKDKGYEELHDMNIHRTFFARDLRGYLRGLNLIYRNHESLQEFARRRQIFKSEAPAWELARGIVEKLEEANEGNPECNISRCLPTNLKTTALKRLNMALRWLVRNDGIVDLGVWDVITPAQLYIPLDVHVGDVARDLGLISRKANDRRTTVELTETLRSFNPADPVLYDYALFSLGLPQNRLQPDAGQ